MKLVIYFADGLGWKYCQETAFMSEFWPSRRPLETILGYSSAIMPCLLSGKLPKETGIWNEYYYEPQKQSRLKRLVTKSPVLLLPANMIRLVLFRFARLRGMPAAHRLRIPLQFSHLFRRHDIDYHRFPPIELNVPTLDNIFDQLGLQYEVIHMEENFDVDEEVQRLKSKLEDLDVIFYSDHYPDANGHKVGTSIEGLRPTVDRIEQFLLQAWDCLGESSEREMLIFSDHGMTDVTETFDLVRALPEFELGSDYLVFMDSTFARFWYLDPQKRKTLEASLSGAPGRFVQSNELAQYGLDFDDDRYGEAIWIADEGVVIHPNYISPTFFRQKNTLVGMHGYWPTDPTSYGVFAYRGSRWQAPVPDPMPVQDVFSVVNGIVNEVRASSG